ncbi:signal recognition particle 14 kDa protein-like isoform X2 [Oncorhynchus nerka]|uniref:signal recognition particle 14 kDa protein-like isoform X2 n=1 Tax=Oncorhynchus nerka TaxID=8023 RepID=UPI0011304743|nr:signal recognition particle 14 kDa protein-like isoform X2 [Oncorhynchus nerka]
MAQDACLIRAHLSEQIHCGGQVDGTVQDDGRTKPVPRKGHTESYEPADNKCLLRASDGKKKISTVVSTKEVIKFQMAYSNLLRAHMDGLKKKDKKSKSKKTNATQ